MKILLRSTFVVGPNDARERDLLFHNYQALVEAGLSFDVDEDIPVWKFIQDFVLAHGHVPEITTLRSHFQLHGETQVVGRLDVLAALPYITGGDFITRLTDKAEDRRVRATTELLKEATTIIQTGMEIRDGRNTRILKGPQDAIRHIFDKSPAIVAPTLGSRLSGEVTGDGSDFLKEYEKVESDPLAGVGQHVGLDQMDAALNGAKRNELWIHAGFTGHCKSLMELNWAYNQAVWYHHSSVIFSLEMPYIQCRRLLFALHSTHEKFRDVRVALGLQKDPLATGVGLPYIHIRDGTLHEFHPNAKPFLFDYVVPDLEGDKVVEGVNPNTGEPWEDPRNYGKIHVEVADPSKNDFTVDDLRQRSELIYAKSPFRTIFVDHAGLMSPRKWVPSTTDRLNEVIRDLKRLAMSFNRGQGIAVVSLFQLSRQGFRTAQKLKEKTGTARYELTDLSYSNECVVEGTNAYTDQGVVPIERVPIGSRVWSSGGWKDVKDYFDQGIQPLWEVVVDRGHQLRATEHHRVRVVADESIQWKAVCDLREGDWVLGCKSTYPWPSDPPSLPPLEIRAYEKPNGDQGVPLKVPPHMTEDLAYLLGAWDGDGVTHKKGVGFTGNRKEVALRQRIQDLFLTVFGHPIPCREHLCRPGSFDMFKWSQPLKRWVDDVSGARGCQVPNAIKRSPKACVLAYLQGLFDTDGWINNQYIIGLSMKSEAFIQQVSELLGALGIACRVKTGTNFLKATGKAYSISTLHVIGWESRVRFGAMIGFTEPSKHDRLQRYLSHTPLRKRSDQRLPFPRLFKSMVRDCFPGYLGGLRESTACSLRKPEIPEDTVRYVIEQADHRGVQDSRLEFFRGIVNNYHVMRVSHVGPLGVSGHVYDIEVDGDHEYQTGPLLSHNCERSADVVTCSWKDDDLARANRVQFQCLKSRDQSPFEIFQARVEWPTRRLLTCDDVIMTGSEKNALGNSIDDAAKTIAEIEGRLST